MAYTSREIAQKRVLDTQLRTEALLADPLYKVSGGIDYSPQMSTVPVGAALVTVQGGDTAKKVLNMLRPLEGFGVQGRESAKGKEESQRTVEMTLEANSWGHAVSTETYGADFVRQQPLQVYKQEKPQLSQWYSQMCGMKMRQGLIETRSYEQVAAPTSGTLGLNRNFLVSGSSSVVAYDPTLATFRTNIASAAASAADLTLDRMGVIQELITTGLTLEPISVRGFTGYVLMVPTWIFRRFFSDFRGEFKFDAASEILPGIRDAVVYNNILVIADPRSVRLNINGGTHTYVYRGPNGINNVSPAGGTNYGVGMILGKGALFEFTNEAIHWEEDVTDYGKNKGVGIFCSQSWTLGQYVNTASVTAANTVNKGSSVILFPGT